VPGLVNHGSWAAKEERGTGRNQPAVNRKQPITVGRPRLALQGCGDGAGWGGTARSRASTTRTRAMKVIAPKAAEDRVLAGRRPTPEEAVDSPAQRPTAAVFYGRRPSPGAGHTISEQEPLDAPSGSPVDGTNSGQRSTKLGGVADHTQAQRQSSGDAQWAADKLKATRPRVDEQAAGGRHWPGANDAPANSLHRAATQSLSGPTAAWAADRRAGKLTEAAVHSSQHLDAEAAGVPMACPVARRGGHAAAGEVR